MSQTYKSREIRLKSRPRGEPTRDHFDLVEVEVAEPREGELLVKNHFMSVDPYMRGRMNDVKSYVPPFQLGQALDGGAVGQVVRSRSPDFQEGDFVVGWGGWREYHVGSARGYAKVDPQLGSLTAYLGVLGVPGQTAYVGLLEFGRPVKGETVFVSAAAGAVGGLVGQIARLKGCRVVGSAGSDDKVRYLREKLGFDDAFNYRSGPAAEALTRTCPEGIDVYFDNVGGEQLEAAIGKMKNFGRIVLCGAISQYNATEPAPGPRNLAQAVARRLTLRGFIVSDHPDQRAAFMRDMSGWLREGKVTQEETVVEGIARAPEAFIGLLRGQNTGKMVVRLDPSA